MSPHSLGGVRKPTGKERSVVSWPHRAEEEVEEAEQRRPAANPWRRRGGAVSSREKLHSHEGGDHLSFLPSGVTPSSSADSSTSRLATSTEVGAPVRRSAGMKGGGRSVGSAAIELPGGAGQQARRPSGGGNAVWGRFDGEAVGGENASVVVACCLLQTIENA